MKGMAIDMENIQSMFVTDGDILLKRFEAFMDLLESELRHELLPVPLQEVAVGGLRTMTGFDLNGWRGYKDKLAEVLDAAKEGIYETTKEEKSKWQEQLRKLEKFMSLIPSEANRFYNDEVQEEVKPLCEVSVSLIKDMLEWLEMAVVKDLKLANEDECGEM